MMTDNASPQGFLPDSEPSIIEDIKSSKHSNSSPQVSQLAQTDNKLQQKVEELNLQGLALYRNENFSEALLFFSECEKLLQYAANCGSAIDYSHILTILHNQAATYQALNDSEKAARYVQAIIYNLTTFVGKQEYIQMISELENLVSKPLDRNSNLYIKEKYQLIKSYLQNLYQLGQYYLQFSGLSSQNQQHKESLDQARKSLTTLKELCLRCYQLQTLQEKSQLGRSLLRELSEVKVSFDEQELKTAHDQFSKLSVVFPDNNQVYHNLFDCLALASKMQLKQTNIHSLFDLTAKSLSESVLEDSPTSHHYNIEICSSHFHHMKKILTIMGAYFAIAVQLEEIDAINSQLYHTTSQYEYSSAHYSQKENKREAEMMLLSALNLSYKYIPVETQLSQYLLELYQETYPQSTPPTEQLKIESCQPLPKEQKQKEKSLIESIIKEYIVDQGDPENKDHNIMKVSINLLTQKYKNYMVQKDISLEQSPSAQCIAKNLENWKQESLKRSVKANIKSSQQFKKSSNWDEEKKESKKLAELFSTDHASNAPITLLKPNFLNSVASIDSISIVGNSQSAQHHSISQKDMEGNIGHDLKHPKPIINQVKIRQIPEGQSSADFNTDAINAERVEGGSKKVHFVRPGKSEKEFFRKSKSTKIIKSKSREHKDSSHRIGFTQKTIHSAQEVSAANNRGKKSPSKKKKNDDFHQMGKLLGSEKKSSGLIGINLSKGFNSTRSFKDNSITFHRVKSPPRMVQSSSQTIKFHQNNSAKPQKMSRTNNIEMLTSINQKPSKSKSKNKTARDGNKKQTKSKSLSSKKSLTKVMMKTSHPCIYTSVHSGSKKR